MELYADCPYSHLTGQIIDLFTFLLLLVFYLRWESTRLEDKDAKKKSKINPIN